MFRFVSTNALHGLKPAILQNLRNNSSIIVQQQSTPGFQTPNSNVNFNNSRFHSYSTATRPAITQNNFEEQIERLKEEPTVRQALRDEAKIKLNYFNEQVSLLHQYRNMSDRDSKLAFSQTFHNILNSFEDKELRAAFTTKELKKYVNVLSYSIYHNRTNRLTGKKNLDKDQYSSSTSVDESILKAAILKLNDIIMNGEVKNILNEDSIVSFFIAMRQFDFFNECIDAWEQGVNDVHLGAYYLSPKVLSVILPVAFKINRFSYDEIIRIFELNTADSTEVSPELLCSIGKVAIEAGDYSRGLDTLESLLKYFEGVDQEKMANFYLGDLHLAFIGLCKDVSIASHFYEKAIKKDLPYTVKLKVPYVQNLLSNCFEAGELFEKIIYFWKTTIAYYRSDNAREINARYSILNNSFFKLFFQQYPELTAGSYEKLKEVISIYNDIKPVDEIFLNTLISNFSWKDKVVFEQLLANYDVFNIKRTEVSHRVVLKKIGEIEGYSNQDILAKWDASLQKLDENRFQYIANADWASIRDATIWSGSYSGERTELYWQIVSTYKNFFQNRYAAVRFIRNWLKNEKAAEALQSLSSIPPMQIPGFRNLKPSVNFNEIYRATVNEKNRS